MPMHECANKWVTNLVSPSRHLFMHFGADFFDVWRCKQGPKWNYEWVYFSNRRQLHLLMMKRLLYYESAEYVYHVKSFLFLLWWIRSEFQARSQKSTLELTSVRIRVLRVDLLITPDRWEKAKGSLFNFSPLISCSSKASLMPYL